MSSTWKALDGWLSRLMLFVLLFFTQTIINLIPTCLNRFRTVSLVSVFSPPICGQVISLNWKSEHVIHLLKTFQRLPLDKNQSPPSCTQGSVQSGPCISPTHLCHCSPHTMGSSQEEPHIIPFSPYFYHLAQWTHSFLCLGYYHSTLYPVSQSHFMTQVGQLF